MRVLAGLDGVSYEAALALLPSGVLIQDAAGAVVYANAAALRILALTQDQIMGRTARDPRWRATLEDGSEWLADSGPAGAVLRTGQPQHDVVVRVVLPDGSDRWLRVHIAPVLGVDAVTRHVVVSFRDITAERQAEEAMAQVTAALASTLDPDTVYQIILSQAARVLPFDNAEIALYKDGWAVSVATLGGPAIAPGTPLVRINPTTSTWAALTSGRPDYLDDTAKVPDWVDIPPWCGPYRVRSRIIVPLLVDGALIGSFKVNSYTPNFYTKHHIRIAAAFGERATQAVRNAQLFAAEQERTRVAEELARLRQEQVEEAEALDAVSAALAGTLDPEQLYQVILEQAARILPCDHAGVTLYARGQATFFATWGEPRITPGYSCPIPDLWLPDEVGSVSYLEDADGEPTWSAIPPLVGPYRARSVLSVPLTSEGTVVGSFWVSSRTPGFYAEPHRRLATVFADRATQAMRNARLYEAEQRRRRAAEDLAHLRSDFVASVSHELRTPLTAIVGFGELLQARWAELSEERRLERIGQIVESANRQKRMVEDLLLVSRMDLAGLAAAPKITPLAALVQQVVAEVQGSYPGQRVIVEGSAEVRVWADAARVVQILVNLLDNAAKYSPEGCPIEVCWVQDGAMMEVRVRDSGPGIPESGKEQLFTRFGRMPGSRVRAGRVGTGLGLYLSRRLAEAMGGELDLEATGPQGSTFRLRLPTAPDAAAVPADQVTPE